MSPTSLRSRASVTARGIAAVTAATLVLAACGGGGDDTDSEDTGDAAAPGETEDTQATGQAGERDVHLDTAAVVERLRVDGGARGRVAAQQPDTVVTPEQRALERLRERAPLIATDTSNEAQAVGTVPFVGATGAPAARSGERHQADRRGAPVAERRTSEYAGEEDRAIVLLALNP